MLRVTSSRRKRPMKPTDYDHEINLVDHDSARTPPSPMTPEAGGMLRSSTTSQLLKPIAQEPEDGSTSRHDDTATPTDQDEPQEPQAHQAPPSPSKNRQHEHHLPNPLIQPSIQVQEPTPDQFHGDHFNVKPKKPHVEREMAVDILYENERGGFLCGVGLFSAQALGGLDPSPWTNAYHKASPTSIHTAQVPDPSWEWAWSEWRINHQEGVDDDGWEYSFAFSRKFSWHGARWWNSFVRRRAWTRKRIKKRPEDISSDPHMLNTDYFAIRPASERTHHSGGSVSSHQVSSKLSMSQVSATSAEEQPLEIEDIETLMHLLRRARIDREKLEAVENYLKHAIDLSQLQNEMHEIMSIFVFQASRRLLLSHLMQIYDEASDEAEKKDSQELNDRRQALKDAAKHADEEVRRLAYWSDVKQMAESGETKGAVDGEKGWHDGWQGVDQSGGAEPNNGKLPSP